MLTLANDYSEAAGNPSGRDLLDPIDAALTLLQAIYTHVEDRFQLVASALEVDALTQDTP